MRKYSQVFLKNKEIAQDIVREFEIFAPKNKKIIEIGPGKGVLTEFLFNDYGDNYTGIEIDPCMVDIIKNRFNGIKIINKDFLEADIDYDISYFIGNLPYHISTAIIEKLLSYTHFDSGVFMLQREVSRKITASEKKSDYGYISALVNLVADTEYLFDVSKNNFYPVPAVDSGVISVRLKKNRITADEFEKYKKFISAAFMHKRKTLVNSISLSKNVKKEEVFDILKKENIKENVRAEALSPQILYRLSTIINI
ncbi:MAG: ribosomal RNA small subunit methyltransferase A [Elusimicrobiales bacterium]|nr:ribosomal RNA small subunit methyltransferase A [Elusimicrobiales bacterium]